MHDTSQTGRAKFIRFSVFRKLLRKCSNVASILPANYRSPRVPDVKQLIFTTFATAEFFL